MKFYLSYWSAASRFIKNNISQDQDISIKRDYFEKCIYLLRKNYKEVIFITDHQGDKYFGDLSWSKKYLDLEMLPKQYGETWSLGKLKAYNMIANFGDSFIHIDYDFFITKPLPKEVLEANILVQSAEKDLISRKYGINYFYEFCPHKYFASEMQLNIAYNCGIIGGNDLNFFKEYSASALQMILHKENKVFWLKNFQNDKDFMFWTKAVLAEQYYLAICLNFFYKNPFLFFETLAPEMVKKHNGWYEPADLGFFNQTGCIHLAGHAKEYLKIEKIKGIQNLLKSV